MSEKPVVITEFGNTNIPGGYVDTELFFKYINIYSKQTGLEVSRLGCILSTIVVKCLLCKRMKYNIFKNKS